MKKNCERCGKEFEAERHLKRYCSDTCRQYAYLERNGLSINRPTEIQQPIEKPSIPEPTIENKPVNDVNYSKTEIIRKNQIPIALKQESVNPVNENSSGQLGELMQEIKELKEQVAKNNQPQIIQSAQPYREKTFQELLDERLNEMDGEDMFTKENYFHWNNSDFVNVNYVNERLKSYLSTLLNFHKQGETDCRNIKTIYDKLEELKKSFNYRYLPRDYPYKEQVEDFSKRLKKVIDNYNEGAEIIFKIRKSVRVEMKAILIEIGNTVPDVDHCPPPKSPKDITQNSYYKKHKRMGFDILKMTGNSQKHKQVRG